MKKARREKTDQNERQKIPSVGEMPQTRIDFWRILRRPRDFWEHERSGECKNACLSILLHVEVTRKLGLLLLFPVGYMLSQHNWTMAALMLALAGALHMWSVFAASTYFAFNALRNAYEASQGIGSLLAKAMVMGLGTPDGAAPADEDPIDRVIRESNELARRKDRGDPPIS